MRSQSIVPPWAPISSRDNAKPSPIPLGFVVTNDHDTLAHRHARHQVRATCLGRHHGDREDRAPDLDLGVGGADDKTIVAAELRDLEPHDAAKHLEDRVLARALHGELAGLLHQ